MRGLYGMATREKVWQAQHLLSCKSPTKAGSSGKLVMESKSAIAMDTLAA
jgi:hypothetical protein